MTKLTYEQQQKNKKKNTEEMNSRIKRQLDLTPKKKPTAPRSNAPVYSISLAIIPESHQQ